MLNARTFTAVEKGFLCRASNISAALMKKYLSCLAAIILAAICYRRRQTADAEPRRNGQPGCAFQFQKDLLCRKSPTIRPTSSCARCIPVSNGFRPGFLRSAPRPRWPISMATASRTISSHVDPRTDLVTVTPVPGTGERYPPFALDPSLGRTVPYDPAATRSDGHSRRRLQRRWLAGLSWFISGDALRCFICANPVSSAKATLLARLYAAPNSSTSGERWYSNSAHRKPTSMATATWICSSAIISGRRARSRRQSRRHRMMHEGKAKALNGGYKHVFLWQAGGRDARLRSQLPGS